MAGFKPVYELQHYELYLSKDEALAILTALRYKRTYTLHSTGMEYSVAITSLIDLITEGFKNG